jgi:hypothetical protein
VVGSRRSKISEFKSTAGLPAGYFGDVYFPPPRVQFGPLLGGHIGIGPPSGAGTLGAAAATYVLTRATIRNVALIARFIGFSPYVKTAKDFAAQHAPALYSPSSSRLRVILYFGAQSTPKLNTDTRLRCI